MPAEPGTFERVALILGDALSPLAQRLQPAQAELTLAQLGVHVPPELLSSAARSALGAAASAAEELPALVTALANSISIDAGGIAIAADAVRLAEKVGRLIEAAVTIGNQLAAMGGAPGVSAAELSAFASALPGRLVEMALIDYLNQKQPTFASLLSLMGVIETSRPNAGSTDPAKPDTTITHLRFSRISDFLSSPEQLGRDLYGWGDPGFQSAELLYRLGEFLARVGLPIAHGMTDDAVPQPSIEFFIASLAGTPPGVAPPGLDLILSLELGEGFAVDIDVAPGLELNIAAEGSAAASARARIQPPAAISLVPPGAGTEIQGNVRAGLARVPGPDETAVTLIGVVGGSRLQASKIGVGAKAHFAWDAGQNKATGDLGIEGRIEGGKLIISLADADGFIGSIMGGFGLEADFDIGFGWTAGGGIFFTGSGGLEVQVPTHVTLGPVEISAIALRLGVQGSNFPIDLTANIKAALGPINASVEQIGARATLSFPANQDGNLGIANIGFSFKPPAGIGLAIDAGVVKGGGYLYIDAERGEYAGAVELVFAETIAIRAIGLITTKNPDGSPGFSLLVVMSVEFGAGIQLGFGFTLLGIGGLIGLNRSMNLEALMLGVRTGAVQSVMFPQDIIANAPRILSDLRTLFPTRQGTFLIGPMLKLGWGTPTLISLAVGVIIEIPGNIAIVGVLKVALPTADAPLILLQVNFAGAIEFDKKRLFFFASIYESRILFMTISGEMGLLVAWGDDANFVVSVGGFHPRFLPPPLPFPSPVRISVSIVNTEYARIQVQAYIAVTSNTAQFGAHAELFFGFSEFSVTGHIGFDALFQFSPFYFIVEVSASASLRAFGVGMFSIRLNFSLEGPTPWRARGTGSISFLFFEISADFDITWGDPSPPALEPIDVLPLLTDEFNKDQSWTALPPSSSNLIVSLRDLGNENALVLHPVGTLQLRQKAVPLDLSIAKVGNRKARDGVRFTISVTGGTLSRRSDLSEEFALGQFLTLDDAAKLSRPAYEKQHGGIELSVSGAAARSARATKRVVRFERVVIDNEFRRRASRFRPMTGLFFDHLLAGSSVALSSLSAKTQRQMDPFQDALAMTGDHFVVASTATNRAHAGTSVFTSEAAAMDHQATLVAADPNLAEALHVIPGVEAVGGVA